MFSTPAGAPCMRVSLAVARLCAIDAEPPVKARMLRELAAWYRAFAARAANTAIWEARLLTADDLEAVAHRIDPRQAGQRTKLQAKGDTQ